MKIIAWLLVSLIALIAPQAALGQFVATLVPAHPAEGEPILVHLAYSTGPQCFPPYSTVSTEGTSIVLELHSTDACAGEDYVTERDYSVGSFARGSYSLRVDFCVSNPPPFPSGCNVLAQFAFDVTGAGPGGGALAVPAASRNSALLLVFVLVIASARALTRHGAATNAAR